MTVTTAIKVAENAQAGLVLNHVPADA